MIRIALLIVLFAAPAFAQQPPEQAYLQKALAVLQQQRNAAMDQAASAQVELQKMAEDFAKLKTDFEEFKKRAEPAK